jgi:hypothetical protein
MFSSNDNIAVAGVYTIQATAGTVGSLTNPLPLASQKKRKDKIGKWKAWKKRSGSVSVRNKDGSFLVWVCVTGYKYSYRF